MGPAGVLAGARVELDGDGAAEGVEGAAQREEARGDREMSEGRAGAQLDDGVRDGERGALAEGEARAVDVERPALEVDRPQRRARAELGL